MQMIVTLGALAYPWSFLRTSQKILIERGPLRSVEGLLVSTKNQHRQVVSIALLQRSVAAIGIVLSPLL